MKILFQVSLLTILFLGPVYAHSAISSYTATGLCAAGINKGFSRDTITMESLLNDMIDPEAVVRYPVPAYTLAQAGSHDRRSISPDQPGWFANADYDQFIRNEEKNGHKEYVMLDAAGPGAIVRIWLGSLAKLGTIRLYLDNESVPSIEIPRYDLMKAGFKLGPGLLYPHSSYEAEGKGGETLYLPLLYQRHCKVTLELLDSANVKPPHYYQINYRTYESGTIVETFKSSHLERYRATINRVEKTLWNPPAAKGKKITEHQALSPDKDFTIVLSKGAQAIRQLQMVLSTAKQTDRDKMWRSVILRIEVDGYQTVWCPLGDFIGSGYGGKPIRSWYRELTDTGTLTSRWIMPYRKSAKVTISNKCDFEVDLHASAIVSPFKWDKQTMYFHSTYKFEKEIRDAKWDYDVNKVASRDPIAPIDWNFAKIQGKGVYFGNTLCVDNHMKSWYGEGDAKAYVDNEKFPSEFGTGLEDYYNTSWAPVVLYHTPFANAPRADNPSSTGFNTFTRTRMLDAIPFRSSFSFDMEMLSWDGGTIDAAAVTYWYAFAGASEK